MEKEGKRRLPPIFKMSVLCNILPYYGYLDGWRELLEKLNLKTNKIWEQNKDALIYFGRNFKRQIKITKDNSTDWYTFILNTHKNRLDLCSFSLSFDSLFGYPFDLQVLLDKLEDGEVMILQYHRNICKDFEIQLWRKENISDFLPAVLCPSYKENFEELKSLEQLISNFLEPESKLNSLWIEKK